MGAFNTVEVVRLIPCPRCGDTGLINVQFAYGDTQQYRYSMGDQIRWGGNNVGEPGLGEVRILGTPEYCRVCGMGIDTEYVLVVENGKIARYELATAKDIAELE